MVIKIMITINQIHKSCQRALHLLSDSLLSSLDIIPHGTFVCQKTYPSQARAQAPEMKLLKNIKTVYDARLPPKKRASL